MLNDGYFIALKKIPTVHRFNCGSVVECLTRDQGVADSSPELSETQNYAYLYARFFPGTHVFR